MEYMLCLFWDVLKAVIIGIVMLFVQCFASYAIVVIHETTASFTIPFVLVWFGFSIGALAFLRA